MSSPAVARPVDGESLGDFVLQRRARRLLDADGRTVRLGSRAMALLIALAERAGEVISQDDLMALAWPGLVVEPNTLRVHMASLRKALGDSQQEARYIATIPGRGYCLVVGARDVRLAAPVDQPLHAEHDAGTWQPTALPPASPDASMVGREQTLQHLVEALPRQRMTTVVGAGGMGKTTLALAAARAVAGLFKHGVCFVDLSQAGAATVAAWVARALGLPDDAGEAPGLAMTLTGRHLLLVLDNCEHVLDAVAELASRWTAPGTRVHVLATSREPLGLPDEQLHWLQGLAMPAPGRPMGARQVARSAALALLAERVRASDGGVFDLRSANIDDAVALCRRVDGMPLAIELVAARVAVMGLKPVLHALDEELLYLRHPRRTAPARHQTLGALLNWSHALLDDTERVVLRRCGLFAGGFTLDAARELLVALGLDALETVGSLTRLLGKSLIQPATDLGPGCFRLQESTRAFARLQMEAAGEAMHAWRVHRRQLSRWMAQARADRGVFGQDEWTQRHGWVGPEIRAAIERALVRPDGVTDALGLVGESWSFALAMLPTELLARLIEQVRARRQLGQPAPMHHQEGLHQVLGHVLQSLTALDTV